MDRFSFFQLALQQLGDRDYVQGSPSGDACELNVKSVFSEALHYGAWTFATKSTTLKLKEGCYALPANCLRLLSCSLRGFRLEGSSLYPKRETSEDVSIRYITDDIARSMELPDNQPSFVRACVLLLAARCASKIAGSIKLGANLEQVAMQHFAEALHKDIIQHASNDQHPLDIILNQSSF